MGKYNYGAPVSINNIPTDEKRAAFKEFAEGLPLLEDCLIAVNEMGFETNSCCRGFHEIEDKNKFITDYLFNKNLDMLAIARCFCPPYISFKHDATKLYGKLSKELINNPNVLIESKYIFFLGPDSYKLMEDFLKDIKGEQKDNLADLSMKIGQRLSPDTYYNSYVYGLTRSGFNEADMECLKIIMGLNACIQSGLSSPEDIHDFCERNKIDESMEEIIAKEIQKRRGNSK